MPSGKAILDAIRALGSRGAKREEVVTQGIPVGGGTKPLPRTERINVITGETEGAGPGPALVSERGGGVVGSATDDTFRDKRFLKSVEEELDAVMKETGLPVEQAEPIAIQNVQESFGSPRPSFKGKTTAERTAIQNKIKERGNENFGESPDVFPGDSPGFATREAGPIDQVTRARTVRPGQGTIASQESAEQLDDLFKDETTREASRIRGLLDDPNINESNIRDAAGGLASVSIGAKRIDEVSKTLFERIAEIEKALQLPKGSQSELANLSISVGQLKKFKKEAAQAAATARRTNDIGPLQDVLDRIDATAARTGGAGNITQKKELSSLLKQLRLREQANRKTNKPRSTKAIKSRIEQLRSPTDTSPGRVSTTSTALTPDQIKLSGEDVLLKTLQDILKGQ